jgi:hypothetical protein
MQDCPSEVVGDPVLVGCALAFALPLGVAFAVPVPCSDWDELPLAVLLAVLLPRGPAMETLPGPDDPRPPMTPSDTVIATATEIAVADVTEIAALRTRRRRARLVIRSNAPSGGTIGQTC